MIVFQTLIIHIPSGAIGLISGILALYFRKGSHKHRAAGKIFAVSMLITLVSGAYLGYMKQTTDDVFLAIFLIFLMGVS